MRKLYESEMFAVEKGHDCQAGSHQKPRGCCAGPGGAWSPAHVMLTLSPGVSSAVCCRMAGKGVGAVEQKVKVKVINISEKLG